ncbi:MAG: OmpA family protein, partial [Fulvivirga sp.]|nr:OmpA family protein [Fulvivirga sp.]
PDYHILIAGHTDNQGNEKVNLEISQKRAYAAKRYLVEKGIDKNRIEAVGYGESKPIADNSTIKGRKKNRRIEFNVIFK